MKVGAFPTYYFSLQLLGNPLLPTFVVIITTVVVYKAEGEDQNVFATTAKHRSPQQEVYKCFITSCKFRWIPKLKLHHFQRQQLAILGARNSVNKDIKQKMSPKESTRKGSKRLGYPKDFASVEVSCGGRLKYFCLNLSKSPLDSIFIKTKFMT